MTQDNLKDDLPEILSPDVDELADATIDLSQAVLVLVRELGPVQYVVAFKLLATLTRTAYHMGKKHAQRDLMSNTVPSSQLN